MNLGRIAAITLPIAALAVTVATVTIPLSANASGAGQAARHVHSRSPYAVYDCGNQPQVRPGSLAIACDGADQLANMKWSLWNGTQAVGSGVDYVNNCTPNCVGGKFSKVNVVVVLWRPQPVHGHHGSFGYSKMTLLFPGSGHVQDLVPPGIF